MSETRSGSNLRQVNKWQREAARAEYLRHPDASIAEVAKATGVAIRTVARAREQLVKEGLLAPGRNATASAADAAALAVAGMAVGSKPPGDLPAEPEELPTPRGSTPTQDDKAIAEMNALLDALSDEDDDTTRKRMLRQVKRFAFDPHLHPDTRMSASQLWTKLLEMQRQKEVGPSVPQTLDSAIERATDFCRAAGAKVMVPAFYKAFELGEPPNGAANAQTVEQGESAQPPTEPVGPSNDNPEASTQA